MSRVRVSSPAPSSMEPRAQRESDPETRTPFECPARQRFLQAKPPWHGSPRANNLVTRSILDGATRAARKRSGDSNAVRMPCASALLPSEATLAWFASSEQSRHPLRPRWSHARSAKAFSGLERSSNALRVSRWSALGVCITTVRNAEKFPIRACEVSPQRSPSTSGSDPAAATTEFAASLGHTITIRTVANRSALRVPKREIGFSRTT